MVRAEEKIRAEQAQLPGHHTTPVGSVERIAHL